MSCEFPRNYEKGSIIVDDHNLYNKIIGPQKLDLSKISFRGQTAPNLFQDFRAYTHQELGYLRHLLAFKGNNSSQVFKGLQDLWLKIRKFKDSFGESETADEVKINARLNKLSGQKSDNSLKPELESLIGEIKKEFNRTIDKYFPTRGFARVEFATREQAERAINFAVSLSARGLSVQALFDRGLPDYMFDSEIIGEAYMREAKFKPGETDKEIAAKTGHHYAKMTQEMIRNYRLRPILNYSNYSDPLVSQVAKTKDEAKDVIASIEGNQPFGFNKRQKKMNKFRMNSKVYKFSSDDEYYSEQPADNSYSAFEKLHDERHEYTKLLNEQFMMFPEKMPKRKEDVDTYQIVPDIEFPLEMVPTRLGVNPGEKVRAYETILSYQEFFHDKIPVSLKKNPEVLQKEKFGDYPNIRYVYQPEDSYNDLNKKFKNVYKRQEVIQNIRKRIRSLPSPEDIAPNLLRYVELGEEERTVRLGYNTQRISTDSEYEDEIEKSSNELDYKKVIEQLNIEKKRYSKKIKLLDELGVPEYEQTISKTFKYEGEEDIDKYIEELNKIPGNEAKWAENNEGEKIVYVGCKVEKPFDVDEARYLSEKYGDLIINSKDEEIEIDPEDVEMMERMKRFILEPNQIFEVLLHDSAYKEFEEKFADFTSIEPIHEFGHLVQQAQEYTDSLNFDKMVEMYSDLFNENEEPRYVDYSDDSNPDSDDEDNEDSEISEDISEGISDKEEKLDFEKELDIEDEELFLEIIDSGDSDDDPDESELEKLISEYKNSSSGSPSKPENSDSSTK